eukprot:CAMPEP_0201565886 /NCGR_PEP_ID=MMETSP0190_2-20130828/5305_1 /ASSEMBLY_ACC=CAM_ASM_000263 /TAXON_ID=37353 /ORGANISM="Rosalina sp." /LENGTH=165 /DNA_ID=CAMNT_0047983885 /DNA_START=64 /DNA_END=558 /DNA_ORIENTATION=-
MDDFLGTSIQYSEQQLLSLEREYDSKIEDAAIRLIESGFLDSDYDGSSGDYSSDDDQDKEYDSKIKVNESTESIVKDSQITNDQVHDDTENEEEHIENIENIEIIDNEPNDDQNITHYIFYEEIIETDLDEISDDHFEEKIEIYRLLNDEKYNICIYEELVIKID